jgi:hypothetical protein
MNILRKDMSHKTKGSWGSKMTANSKSWGLRQVLSASSLCHQRLTALRGSVVIELSDQVGAACEATRDADNFTY